MRGEGGYQRLRPAPLPGPDDEFDDLGEVEPDPEPLEDDDLEVPDWVSSPRSSTPPAEVLEADDDPDPGWLRAEPGGKGAPKPARKTTRVTIATRKDVEAKLGLMLEIPGRMWQARDPYCGGAFVAQLPEIRPALTELICQSPDLVAWFTGTGGGFMLWLNLMVACQPVLMTIWAHHIAHAIAPETSPDALRPDYASYAA